LIAVMIMVIGDSSLSDNKDWLNTNVTKVLMKNTCFLACIPRLVEKLP